MLITFVQLFLNFHLQIYKFNTPIKRGSLKIKRSEQVRGGRAIYLEMDLQIYHFVKSNDHKLAFVAMDVDYQVAPPTQITRKVSLGQQIPGVTRLPEAAMAVATASKGVAVAVAAASKGATPATSFKEALKTQPARHPRLAKLEQLKQQQLHQQQLHLQQQLSTGNDSQLETSTGEGKRRRNRNRQQEQV